MGDVVQVIGPVEGNGGDGPIQIFSFGGCCHVDCSRCSRAGWWATEGPTIVGDAEWVLSSMGSIWENIYYCLLPHQWKPLWLMTRSSVVGGGLV